MCLLLCLSSCLSVRFVSEYDEITDKAVTSLQHDVSKFLVKLEADVGTPDAVYEHYKKTYQEFRVSLRDLKIRTDAMDHNTILQQQLEALTQMVASTEKLHQSGFTDLAQVIALEQPFNSAFVAMNKFLIAQKRGKKSKS